VKYADGPTTEVDVLVNAPLERVWSLISDINTPARFSSELIEAEWCDEGSEPAVGARFVGRSFHPAAGNWETTCSVTSYEPLRSFAWAVGDPDYPSATWRFDLEPAGDLVRLRQTARLGPAPSGLTPAIIAMPDKEERIVARRLEEHRSNMQATIEGIKSMAEAGP
jgi:Polyketide cyclase / dehydrase and lipid transport